MSSTKRQPLNTPTMMRFERVQEILENDAVFKTKLGAKDQPIQKRNSESKCFSKEVVDVVMAIHEQGLDAHHIPKSDVLRWAIKVLKLFPDSNDGSSSPPPRKPAGAAGRPKQPPPPPEKKVEKPKAPPPKPTLKKPPTPPPAPKKPAKLIAKIAQAKPVSAGAPKKPSKPEAPKKPKPVSAERIAPMAPEAPALEAEEPRPKTRVDVSNLGDKQKFPDFEVQSTIYSLLLSCLSMSVSYERGVEFESRRTQIEDLVLIYQNSCDGLRRLEARADTASPVVV